jgi:hypothetical protein
MVSAGRLGIAVLLLSSFLAGCSSVGTSPHQTTTSTMADATTTTETTLESETGTGEAHVCRVEKSEYDVPAPEKVAVLNRTTAGRVAVRDEKRYQRARHETIHDVSYYDSSLARIEVEDAENGFEITVKLRVDVETRDGDQLSGGYPHTYRVSESEVVRDGRTVACWNADD